MKISEEQKRAINTLKQIDNFDDLCETCYYIDTERKTKYGCCGCREEAKDIVLNLIEKLQKENEELKEDLKYVLNQTLGAFEKNWCIDWNFTEIREKYNLESEE